MSSWARQKEESAKAYEAFTVYRDMGAERSQERVGQALGKSKEIMERWSARWNWVERCKDYDAWLYVQQEVAREEAIKEEAEKWAKRKIDAADKLFDKALKMLAFPLSQQRSEKDGKVVIVNPARWQMRDAAVMAEMALKLAGAVESGKGITLSTEDESLTSITVTIKK